MSEYKSVADRFPSVQPSTVTNDIITKVAEKGNYVVPIWSKTVKEVSFEFNELYGAQMSGTRDQLRQELTDE